ncbi:unnamed protein product (macronuclear) [Paramecium tetraurelia]|uniref:RING-CH-type domain-containing protein n=1 Tax=Paramecium tetraurelia TaxID=5888 RepID=A0C0P5_PARTE|nr:uncharacterized protein GSPATT00033838001 [Paramecium tetraurelia]CAK64362.1 unnamed protein product [Paramecium tetraurelia]|eukprot:XP_001431760.1 hypothetical protein (macronuclear) [Paramecium tetraurelia strain d4-2]
MQFCHKNRVFVKQQSLDQSENNGQQHNTLEQDLIELGFQTGQILFVPRIESQKMLMQTIVVKDTQNKSIHVNLNPQTVKKVKMYLNNQAQKGQLHLQHAEINTDKLICRICLEDGQMNAFIKPCECKGSIQYVHEDCLKTWLLRNHKIDEIAANRVFCELCKKSFDCEVQFEQKYEFSQLLRIPKNQKYCLLSFLILSLFLYGLGITLGVIIYENENFIIACIIGIVLSFFIGLIIQILLLALVMEIISITKVLRWNINEFKVAQKTLKLKLDKKRIYKSNSAPVLTVKEDFVIKILTKKQTNLDLFS